MINYTTLLRSWFVGLIVFLFPSCLYAQSVDDTFTASGLSCKVLSVDVATKSGQVEITGSDSEVGEELEIPATLKQTYADGEWTFSITAIGTSAFAECKTLKTVKFPAPDETSLSVIGPLAFHHCTSLTSINLEDTKIEVLESLFTKNEADEAYFDDLTQLKLPETLKEIKSFAMQFLGITSITIPASVTAIGEGILEGNIYLEEFYWKGAQVTSLPLNTFLGDDALKIVYFLTVDDIDPNGLTDRHFERYGQNKATVYVTPSSYEVLTANGYNNEESIFSILIADTEWTGIEHIGQDAASKKSIDETSHAIYTLQGVRVSHPVQGHLYISGGRKYIYK